MIPAGFWRRDYLAAGLLVVMGSAVALRAGGYRIGTLTSMGPGFLPLLMGVLMVAVGVLIGLMAVPSLEGTGILPPGHGPRAFEFRSWAFIIGGVACFILFGEFGGFVPASVSCVFISALGDRQNSFRDAALLACVTVAAGYLIFHWGFNLQFEAFSGGESWSRASRISGTASA
jgi:hypothetical protein